VKMTFEELLEIQPYSLNKEQKKRILTQRLVELTQLHREHCSEYAQILDSISFDENKIQNYEEIPFLPVRLFKELSLKSVLDEDIVKTMTSSGTSGQAVSKIYLDKRTSSNQQKAMVKIVNEFTGSSRMPMIILDCPSVVKNRAMFSARGAGILGFSIFGAKKIYALDDEMKLDVDGLKEFLEKYNGQRIFMFGFTFMIWQHFYKELERLKKEGVTFDLSNAVLIHGGGWKKLVSEAVSPEEFHQRLKNVCGLDHIHDYYGMVEQTGCIYMQCECGHLHASIFSDVIMRRPEDFNVCDIGEKGIIQVVSTIPESYPGHSLITEDEGVLLGEDDCPCGRKGKYFKIYGRLKNAEIRGCSDTYAAKFN
jgi:phenylacetate-coenzyme A ligase PaaK-like adenylate-forming protein